MSKDVEQQRDELLAALTALITHMPYKATGDGNGPAHPHKRPGFWNYDGGPMDGQQCDWCKAWADATELVNSAAAEKVV